jgi:hypothetical protein
MDLMNVRFVVLVGSMLVCAAGLVGATEAVAACSNGALRAEARSTQLSQCRAYELVSPVYTADSGVLYFNGAAPDGEAAEFLSAGGFAGIGSEFAFNHYIARRVGETGWITSWVGVPAALRGLLSGVTSSYDLTKQVARVQFLVGEKAGSTGLFFSKNLAEAPAFSFEELLEYRKIPQYEKRGIGQAVDESPEFSDIVIPGFDFEDGEHELYELAGVGGPTPVLRTVTIEPPPKEKAFYGVPGNGEGNQNSVFHAISNDGAEIFFTNEASGLSYVRVNGSETLELGGLFQGASENGAKVFLESVKSVKSAGGELYMDVIDSEPGREAVVERVAIAPAGDSNIYLRSSDDGSHLYFLSTGVLAANKNENGEEAETGKNNLYVYDTETDARKAAFIAQAPPGVPLPGGDIAEGEIEAQVNGCPSEELGEAKEAGCEGGRFFVFTTTAHITPDDTSNSAQVFEYDADTGKLARISIGEEGYAENGNGNLRGASIAVLHYITGNESQTGEFEMNTRAVSDNGSTVVFSTSGALSPRAVNDLQSQSGPQDIYEWHEGEVSLISTGHSLTSDEQPMITPSGRDIFFTSTEGILPQDTDGLKSLYDARIDGGFPAAPIPAGGCKGDSCQGPPSVPSLLGESGSATFSGLGNLQPPVPTSVGAPKAKPRHCGKGYVKRRGRCVRRPKVKRAGKSGRTKR